MTENAEPTAPEMDPSPLDKAPEGPSERSPEAMALAGKVEEHLLDVIDPELGINVIDLGLVYDIWIEDKTAVLNMTLTSPACPLQDVLEDQARDAVINNVDEVSDLKINWVWSPAWGPHMINEEGREQLRFLGFTV
ncbi:metal-sulfur cluster assembly factor [Corynebacterium jeikeium]|uniref:metal-sulfur cluster assembly factor n=1 Tax=Corynebacterium jeikeium TaxID=38289 RepID=UPI0001B71A08|nr:metal-sulfur cluster assembly factor [Corynebacterium jeikeium]EEW16318.1 hypothetical protein HMPREF0297_1236 [Corynebacterium jeikeium ATCC 43734]OOD34067.1 metal-sulfur cluster biosynthesis protein [Corynebacterium jeikeium]WCZ53532.1 hypothetical protein CJEIK_05085 [Corynebacterium jeikeium]SUY81157.1 metal-sulfur cluster biosynthetic enzyme [Corynebacterium jeikeium]